MDVPISIGVLLTLGVSVSETIQGGRHAYFDAAVSLLFLLLIGRWLDHQLRAKAHSAARDLLALQAPIATRAGRPGRWSAAFRWPRWLWAIVWPWRRANVFPWTAGSRRGLPCSTTP